MSYISAGNTTTTTLVQYGDTTGNLVFATGGANTAALTINNAQNLQLNAAGTKLLNSSGNPMLAQTGAVLQVVNANYSTYQSTSSTSYSDTGLSASITPATTSSKVLVLFTFGGVAKINNIAVKLQLIRGTTSLLVCETAAAYTNDASWNRIGGSGYSYLDSPANVSAQTYKLQYASDSTGTAYVQLDPAASTITLMEIAG
jgi:hypothetical protein